MMIRRENVFRRTEISENILHCNTIQEARSMLADIAPHWEHNFVEKGISIGKQEGISIGKKEGISIGKQEGKAEGIRDVLYDLVQSRFDILPKDARASIACMTDINALMTLTREVYNVASLEEFLTLLKSMNISKI